MIKRILIIFALHVFDFRKQKMLYRLRLPTPENKTKYSSRHFIGKMYVSGHI